MVKTWMLAGAAIVALMVTLALLVSYDPAAQLGGSSAQPTALYDIVGSNGSVYNFGAPGSHGSLAGKPLDEPIAGIAVTPNGKGYWFVGAGGAVYPFGDAGAYGSVGNKPLNKPIVGMAATPDGKGYWLVASDGGIFAFGDAGFHGSMGAKPLNKPIVGMAATPDGKGYWLVASDGGIFAFGDAGFHGSTGAKPLNSPIVGMAATSDGNGYWLVASDGDVVAFGDAGFHGSMAGKPLNKPVVGIAAAPGGKGYWLVASRWRGLLLQRPLLRIHGWQADWRIHRRDRICPGTRASTATSPSAATSSATSASAVHIGAEHHFVRRVLHSSGQGRHLVASMVDSQRHFVHPERQPGRLGSAGNGSLQQRRHVGRGATQLDEKTVDLHVQPRSQRCGRRGCQRNGRDDRAGCGTEHHFIPGTGHRPVEWWDCPTAMDDNRCVSLHPECQPSYRRPPRQCSVLGR